MELMSFSEYFKKRVAEDVTDDTDLQALADIIKANPDLAKAKNPINQAKVNANLQKTADLIRRNKLAASKPSAAAKAVDIGSIVSNNS